MRAPLIRAVDVAKRYRVGGPPAAAGNLREAVTSALTAPLRRLRENDARRIEENETFWALDGVSFEVRQGEVLGILGRNGAGKSTLLKVLSRVTEPTRGRIELRGRVASLLEVGTGFHAELTGRENIYMNGTILGMRKREIDAKFDEIVAFSEIERFIDTPVKRYSSGMYVRLAFAVAAHLEPEVLIVDEVLAVGDAAFQKKCLGKMDDVAHQGRTVLFVSHNMAALTALCTRALLLDRGRVVMDGVVDTAVKRYLEQASQGADGKAGWAYRYLSPTARVRVEAFEMLVNGVSTQSVQAGDRCVFRVHYRATSPEAIGKRFSPQVQIFTEGQKIMALWPNAATGDGVVIDESGAIDCVVDRWPFRTRNMHVDLLTWFGPEVQEHILSALVFSSHDGDYHGTGVVPHANDGFVFLDHRWSPAPSETPAEEAGR